MNLLILGANSDVGIALARRMARADATHVCLASRDLDLLERRAADLRIRSGIVTRSVYFDAEDCTTHEAFYRNLAPKPDVVVVAFGEIGDQHRAQSDFSHARTILDINFTGAASILEIVAADFERRRSGTIIAISSVAGERGRRRNYFYGAAKAALTTYLSGLRNRLADSEVDVLTVLPGFIRTKMNDHLSLPAFLTATPEAVADDIHRAYKSARNLIYTRWYWRWILLAIRSIPESVFKHTRL